MCIDLMWGLRADFENRIFGTLRFALEPNFYFTVDNFVFDFENTINRNTYRNSPEAFQIFENAVSTHMTQFVSLIKFINAVVNIP
jgi:hypothetical protein